MSADFAACPVAAARAGLRQAWEAAEGRPHRPLLARAARLATEVALGRAGPGHLAALAAAAGSLTGQPEGARLAASLADPAWRRHVDGGECGPCAAATLPPCQEGCPAHVDIPGFMALLGHGDYAAAVALIARDNPLPFTCGLVCPAPCEAACVRAGSGGAVFVRPLKAVAAGHALAESGAYPQPRPAPSSGRRVAVVGSGPAGLAAAYVLALAGHAVEVLEAAPRPGGMLRYGIPAYRLPDDVLDRELAQFARLGIVFRTGLAVTDVAALKRGVDAVFLAVGAQLSRRLPLPGAEQPFVLGGVDFLRAVRGGAGPRIGPRVVVVGGGNVAVDVALTARRQGAGSVAMVCLERRDEMPASPGEVRNVLEEGVALHPGWGPVAIAADGTIGFRRCLRVFDSGHRFAPEFDESETLALAADHVLLAVGQTADLDFLVGSGVAVERGLIAADPLTLETALPGVFAGGDSVHGPRTVVAAIRAGKQAAAAIAAHLAGRPAPADWDGHPSRARVAPLAVPAALRLARSRAAMPERPVAERGGDQVIELGLDDAAAAAEASRCLRCDLCLGCGLCELACSEMGAEALRMVPAPRSGRLVFADFTRPAELCLGCGACAAICPTAAIRIKDADGMRNTVITGTVVARQALDTCRACGAAIAPAPLHRRAGGGALCPDCARRQRAAVFAGMALD